MWQSSCLSSQGVGLQVWATMLGEAIFKELNHCTMMQAPLDSNENQNDVTSTKNKIKIKMLPNIPRNQERRRKPKFPTGQFQLSVEWLGLLMRTVTWSGLLLLRYLPLFLSLSSPGMEVTLKPALLRCLILYPQPSSIYSFSPFVQSNRKTILFYRM